MDWYYEQLEMTRPVTEKSLYEMRNKSFTSGRLINVGDIIFYGRLMKNGYFCFIKNRQRKPRHL